MRFLDKSRTYKNGFVLHRFYLFYILLYFIVYAEIYLIFLIKRKLTCCSITFMHIYCSSFGINSYL